MRACRAWSTAGHRLPAPGGASSGASPPDLDAGRRSAGGLARQPTGSAPPSDRERAGAGHGLRVRAPHRTALAGHARAAAGARRLSSPWIRRTEPAARYLGHVTRLDNLSKISSSFPAGAIALRLVSEHAFPPTEYMLRRYNTHAPRVAAGALRASACPRRLAMGSPRMTVSPFPHASAPRRPARRPGPRRIVSRSGCCWPRSSSSKTAARSSTRRSASARAARVFHAYKFRSMIPDAERNVGALQAGRERSARHPRRPADAGDRDGRTAAALEHLQGRHELRRAARPSARRDRGDG